MAYSAIIIYWLLIQAETSDIFDDIRSSGRNMACMHVVASPDTPEPSYRLPTATSYAYNETCLCE